MKTRAIDFVLLNVSDIKKAKAFYQEVLGIDAAILSESGPWLEFDTKPVAMALMQNEPWPKTAIALAVSDVRAAMEELQAKGVAVTMEPIDTPDCIMAAIADPDGNDIIIHQRKDGTAG